MFCRSKIPESYHIRNPGKYADLFRDVAFRLAPITKRDAIDMIKVTKGYQIIKGYRGQARYDMKAIIDCLLRLSQLIIEFPQIKELEMNPIKVLEDGKGILIMDAKVALKEKESGTGERVQNRKAHATENFKLNNK